MANTVDLLCRLELVVRRRRPAPSGEPNPRELLSLVKSEEVEQHRSLFCVAYDECLDVATRRGWKSWTCRCCDLFQLSKALHAEESAREATRRPFQNCTVQNCTVLVLRTR